MLPPLDPARVKNLIGGLLDNGYIQQASRVIETITTNSTTGIIAQRLADLDAEAARLAADGKRMTRDNAYVTALLADMERIMIANGVAVDNASTGLRENAVQTSSRVTREIAIAGLPAGQRAQIIAAWNVPRPEAVAQLINYATSEAWRDELKRYGAAPINRITDIAIYGMTAGLNPRTTAAHIRRVAEDMPSFQAEAMMRTLQLESYRKAETADGLANEDILSHKIRISALGARTCMSCIALHGTRLRLDEDVLDHWNGRCTSIMVVRGINRVVLSGEDWFRALPEAAQRTRMGPGAYDAWQAGKIQLRDFVHTYDDRVFGPMIRRATLTGMLN